MAGEARRAQRLDQPRVARRGPSLPSYDPDAFGRVSERIARFFGTARYLGLQTGFVIVWIIFNAVVGYRYLHQHPNCDLTGKPIGPTATCQGSKPFDPFPFILLNLAFSTQAAYAAPLILLAQNRQADRDRVQIEEDRARNERSIADTEYLAREVAAIRIALGDVVTRDFLRSELRTMLAEADREPDRETDRDTGRDAGRVSRRDRDPDRDDSDRRRPG